MKRFALLSALAGLGVLTVLVAYSGLGEVAGAVVETGWGTALVVLARAVALVAAGVAWLCLFPQGRKTVSVGVSILVRFVREGVNQLLPVGQVGGDVVGARLATFWNVNGALAGAATIADVGIQVATQAAFAVGGLALLLALKGDSEVIPYALAGLGTAALMIAGLFLVQARSGGRWLSAVLRKVAGGLGASLVDRLWRRLGVIYARPARIASGAVIHLAVWVLGSFEVYVALHFMGYPVTVAEAIVIESLGQAIRGAAFVVPGGLGVQEGGYIALCGLFGVPPGPALALSLVKRVADLVLGLPSIALWQVLEGRRALGITRTPSLAESRG